MLHALPLDDDTYAVIAAYAKEQHCSLAGAVRKLVAKAAPAPHKSKGGANVRFPLVLGGRPITNEDVARLQDQI